MSPRSSSTTSRTSADSSSAGGSVSSSVWKAEMREVERSERRERERSDGRCGETGSSDLVQEGRGGGEDGQHGEASEQVEARGGRTTGGTPRAGPCTARMPGSGRSGSSGTRPSQGPILEGRSAGGRVSSSESRARRCGRVRRARGEISRAVTRSSADVAWPVGKSRPDWVKSSCRGIPEDPVLAVSEPAGRGQGTQERAGGARLERGQLLADGRQVVGVERLLERLVRLLERHGGGDRDGDLEEAKGGGWQGGSW